MTEYLTILDFDVPYLKNIYIFFDNKDNPHYEIEKININKLKGCKQTDDYGYYDLLEYSFNGRSVKIDTKVIFSLYIIKNKGKGSYSYKRDYIYYSYKEPLEKCIDSQKKTKSKLPKLNTYDDIDYNEYLDNDVDKYEDKDSYEDSEEEESSSDVSSFSSDYDDDN